jgi:hypothetical protein
MYRLFRLLQEYLPDKNRLRKSFDSYDESLMCLFQQTRNANKSKTSHYFKTDMRIINSEL